MQEFHLTKQCKRYVFRVIADAVQITLIDGGWKRAARLRTKQEARNEYAMLLRRGYERW